ncbi:hypothetical protein Btru_041783 [Bulinus truncatus]|nr:hypothetical protein Btru_041783 [Bulinus truncatus]
MTDVTLNQGLSFLTRFARESSESYQKNMHNDLNAYTNPTDIMANKDASHRHDTCYSQVDMNHHHDTNHDNTCHCLHDIDQCYNDLRHTSPDECPTSHDDSHQCQETVQQEDETRPMFGKFILLACGTITFGLSLSLPISLSVMFLEWQDAFDVTRAHTAAVHSTCIGIIFSGGIVAGCLMDKFGARTTCLIGSFLASLGLFLGFFTSNIDYLIATTGVLTGSGFCLLQLPCMPCVTQPFTKYRSLSISVCSFGAAVMNMVFPHVYRLLVDRYSWRGAYLIISGLALQTCITSLIMTSRRRVQRAVSSVPVEEHLLSPNEDERSCNGAVLVGVNVDSDCISSTQDRKWSSHETLNGHGDGFVQNGDMKHCLRSLHHDAVENGDKVNKCHTDLHNGETYSHNGNKVRHVSSLRARYLKMVAYLNSSDWNFIRDPMYLLYLLCLGITLSSLFACYILLMDVARTKHFDQPTGAIFILAAAMANLGGRLLVCLLNLSQRIHSFMILCMFGGAASVALILLGFMTEFVSIVACLVIIGAGIGGMVSIYPKCALDISTACHGSYPLALGVTCTSEGIFDFMIPIVIGYMVDISDSYILPFTFLGCLSLLMTSILSAAFFIHQRHQR